MAWDCHELTEQSSGLTMFFSATLLISACFTHKQMACQVILGIVYVFLLQIVQKWKKIMN